MTFLRRCPPPHLTFLQVAFTMSLTLKHVVFATVMYRTFDSPSSLVTRKQMLPCDPDIVYLGSHDVASSPEGERGTKGPNLAGSHTRVARYVTWKPVRRPVLPASAHRSAHARDLSRPLGPATFWHLASDLGLGSPHLPRNPDPTKNFRKIPVATWPNI